MNGPTIDVVEIEGYDPAISTTRTLYFATKGFNTRPSETPANTFFDERITQALDIARTYAGGHKTRGSGSSSIGELVLSNLDGALDFMNEMSFDGRRITIRRTTTYNPSYPSDFVRIYRGTTDGAEFSLKDVSFRVRDARSLLNVALQPNRYAGSNVLPDGLEGVPEDLGGKVKPLCFGVVKNAPAPCVNTSKLIYQVNDGPIHSLDAVYDRGVGLERGHVWNSAGTITVTSTPILWYGGGLWVLTNWGDGNIYTSPDGATWTLKYTLAGTFPHITFAAYHAGEWLLSGYDGTTTGVLLHTTDDFATVTTSSTPTGQDVVVLYHEQASLWIMAVFGFIYSSPDASTWTLRSTGSSRSYSGGAYLNGMAVIVAGDVITSSADGVTWVDRTTGITSGGGVATIVAGPDRFVAVGGRTALMSLDGITFTRSELPTFVLSALQQIAYARGAYVTSEPSLGGFLASADGLEWEAHADGLSGTIINALASDGTNLVSMDTSTVRYTTLTDYSSESDLLNDALAPLPGQCKAYLAGGYFRLGSTPDGIITADATEGATSAERTVGGIAYRLFTGPGGIDPSELDISSFEDFGYVP